MTDRLPTRLNQRIGRGLLLLAFVVGTAMVIHPFAIHGFVWGGKVEDGRYFVVSKGNRYTEVSEIQWRIEQFLECSFPWVPVVLIWMGLAFRDGPGVPQKLTTFLGIVGVIGALGGVLWGWVVTGEPWTPALCFWLVVWGICFLVAWRQPLSAPSQSDAGAAPDHTGITASQS